MKSIVYDICNIVIFRSEEWIEAIDSRERFTWNDSEHYAMFASDYS